MSAGDPSGCNSDPSPPLVLMAGTEGCSSSKARATSSARNWICITSTAPLHWNRVSCPSNTKVQLDSPPSFTRSQVLRCLNVLKKREEKSEQALWSSADVSFLTVSSPPLFQPPPQSSLNRLLSGFNWCQMCPNCSPTKLIKWSIENWPPGPLSYYDQPGPKVGICLHSVLAPLQSRANPLLLFPVVPALALEASGSLPSTSPPLRLVGRPSQAMEASVQSYSLPSTHTFLSEKLRRCTKLLLCQHGEIIWGLLVIQVSCKELPDWLVQQPVPSVV